jgi:fused signal recognition particle receptor
MIWGLFDKNKNTNEAAPEQAPEQAKGLFDGLRKSSAKLTDSFASVFTKEKLDAADIAELEEALIASDMGASSAARISGALVNRRFSKENGATEAREALAVEIAAILKAREAVSDLSIGPKPRVVLVIGVNGSGKTTTIGKLAKKLTSAGAKVVIGAGDTFRAAAIEQLKVWADRAGADFVASTQGADAAGVAFETVKRAKEEGADVALIDTAGRLQNKSELMAELAKIIRVMRKLDEDAPHETLLVLDATVGQNALSQVENFRSVTELTGLIMTKLDGTAKGGVLVAVAQRHAIPIHFIGVGESADDLQPFDARAFSRALVGLS